MIPPGQVEGVWPVIEPGIAEIAARQQADWSTADIRRDLDTAKAQVVLGSEHGRYAGFLVVTEKINYPNVRTMHIWLAYGRMAHPVDGYSDVIEQIGTLARLMGYAEVTASVRPGMAKRLRNMGFRTVHVEMRAKVGDLIGGAAWAAGQTE